MATQTDKIIAFAKSKLGSRAYDNYCQKFVRECCEAGGIYGQAASAAEAWKKWGKSSTKNIPLCAAVYFNGTGAGAVYGHVGLYVGDGYVIHAWSGVRQEKLEDIAKKTAYKGWGYQGGIAPSGLSAQGMPELPAAAKEYEPDKLLEEATQEYDPSRELEQLKTFLSRLEDGSTGEIIERAAEIVPESPELSLLVLINGDKPSAAEIPVVDDLQVVYERVGVPGKLTFKTIIDKDNTLASKETLTPESNTTDADTGIKEGDRVSVRIDGKILFVGYVFTIQRDKNELLTITAYNQIRYLKNKDTRIYKNMSAADLIKAIAADFGLVTGDIDETVFKLSRIEEDTALIDIILNALDETFMSTGQVYTLFDKEGKLSLKNISAMKLEDILICEDTAQDYTYKTTIDSGVYNQIKLVYPNEETGSYDAYITKDSTNIENWGLLQYFEKIKHPALGPLKSTALLKSFNRLARNLTINGALGNVNVIAGALIPIMLNLGDIEIKNFMMVEKVTHKVRNKEYFMDLIVTGGDFVV